MVALLFLAAASAAELPEVGPYDRYRVDVPGWEGAEATSTTGSVLLAPPPPGVPYRVEEAPVPDAYVPYETFEALAVPPWHEEGVDGAGVKVAVFDVQWFNAELEAAELGAYTTHDCQAHLSCDVEMDTLRPRYSFEEGSHGVACAQLIRDLAPGVELHLVRVNGGTTLENAGAWAAREGIDVISMSMSFFNTSFYDGTGPVSGAVGHTVGAGPFFVGSAGNYAEEHWDGPFEDEDGDDALDFPWGSGYLPVYLGAPSASVLVNWDEYDVCGDTDFDAYVYAQDGTLVGKGEARQDPTADSCAPVERVGAYVENTGWYYLQIRRVRGEGGTRVAVYARGGAVYEPTPGGLADPASSPSTFSVGAVRVGGYAFNGPEAFSSTGPTHAGVAKPDIAGPDGVTTSIYGSWGFYGTSAATPAVAGLIALVMDREGVDAATAARMLQANAISDRATWEDWDGELGAGRARLWPLDAGGACGGAAGAWAIVPGLLWIPRRRKKQS